MTPVREADPMAEPRACARCGRATSGFFESPAGDLRSRQCLRYVGTNAEPDPEGPVPRPPAWIDLRVGPCWGCSDQVPLPKTPGGALRAEGEA